MIARHKKPRQVYHFPIKCASSIFPFPQFLHHFWLCIIFRFAHQLKSAYEAKYATRRQAGAPGACSLHGSISADFNPLGFSESHLASEGRTRVSERVTRGVRAKSHRIRIVKKAVLWSRGALASCAHACDGAR